MKKSFSFSELALMSLTSKEPISYECNITLSPVCGEVYQAYDVSVSKQELLFFCDKGTVTYVVDSYGGRAYAELFDWNKDEE